jgi:hypothetical protein
MVWLAGILLHAPAACAQEVHPFFDAGSAFSQKIFRAIQERSSGYRKKLSASTAKYTARLKKEEDELWKKLATKDTLLARFISTKDLENNSHYVTVHQQFTSVASTYSGRLDSLATAVRFLQTQASVLKLDNGKLQQTLTSLDAFKSELEHAEHITNLLQQRSTLLQQQVQRLGMHREMRRFSKQLYYYQAQVAQYKKMFESPRNIELKLLQVVSEVPQFRKFFAANAQLARLFTLPDPDGAAMPSLAGMQTRSSISALLIDRFGTDVPVQNLLPSQEHSMVSELKNKWNQYKEGSLGNGTEKQVEGQDFKPNQQKTKSLVERLEWGADVQSQKSSHFFPVSSNMGLLLGYKLNDKSLIGVGAAYKMGWGKGWNNLQISHQGFGFRSFVDWQVKGSFYLRGGYERNYSAVFKNISVLKQHDGWQSSGLLGVSRKFKSGKIKANMQLLWDFLSHRQVPRTQPLVWRIGYSLK